MSSKRDWNDMSDSESDSDHPQEIEQTKQDQQVEQMPSLSKIVSSPLPEKKSPNEQQNLLKLQNCQKEQVWLYIPLFYKENIDDVDQILKATQNLKKVDKFSKGWNVLTSKEAAKEYIIEGKKDGKFFIKFYFSNRNQQSYEQNNSHNNYRKNDNYRNFDNDKKVKYVPKSPNGKAEIKNLKQPDSIRRIESHQDYVGGRTPKSPNYKNQQWKKYDDSRDYRQKNYNNQNSRDGNNRKRAEKERESSDSLDKDRNAYNNNNAKGYKPKYMSKNEPQSKVETELTAQLPRKKYVQKQQDEPKVQTSVTQNKKPEEKLQKVETKLVNQSPKQQSHNNEDQGKNSPNEKKPKKKNKKKNQMLKDDNNPFSMLNGI